MVFMFLGFNSFIVTIVGTTNLVKLFFMWTKKLKGKWRKLLNIFIRDNNTCTDCEKILLLSNNHNYMLIPLFLYITQIISDVCSIINFLSLIFISG